MLAHSPSGAEKFVDLPDIEFSHVAHSASISRRDDYDDRDDRQLARHRLPPDNPVTVLDVRAGNRILDRMRPETAPWM
ncbi:hypothetical protein GCM10009608_59730 [Pseudonocardia alaniniphila]